MFLGNRLHASLHPYLPFSFFSTGNCVENLPKKITKSVGFSQLHIRVRSSEMFFFKFKFND